MKSAAQKSPSPSSLFLLACKILQGTMHTGSSDTPEDVSHRLNPRLDHSQCPFPAHKMSPTIFFGVPC